MMRSAAGKAPVATLTFEESRDAARLKFTFASGDAVPDVIFRDLRPIQQAWQRAGRDLRRLVAESPERPDSADELRAPLTAILDAGARLGQRLADGDAHRYSQIRQAFQRSWPTWGNPSRDDIPIVQLVGHETTFPVELLPVFSNEEIRRLENDAALATAAQRFLGFSAVIRRVVPGVSPAPDLLKNDHKLPIQFVRYLEPERGLRRRRRAWTGFEQEQEFMTSLSEVLVIDGPWPTSQVPLDQIPQRLVAALFDPSRRLGADPGPPAELSHFACHCETDDRPDDEYELIFTDERGQPCSVSLGQIQNGYDRLEDPNKQPPPRAPVILNACGTSTVNPWSALSFHRWFLKNRHRAFIGTQVAIPGDVAADFAERFYRYFLGGYTFGEATVLARRQLLADTRSMLGLLYVLFGNDLVEAQIKHPRLLPASPVA